MALNEYIGKRIRVVRAHPFGGGQSRLNGKVGVVVDAYGLSSLTVQLEGETENIWFSVREVDII